MLCNFRYAILYGSEEDSRVPYFVRNQHKYPDILPQPGVNIECVSTSVNYQNFVLFDKKVDFFQIRKGRAAV